MTFQWPSIGGSDLMECAIFQYGNSILHLALSKRLLNLETDADRWVWFHIVKGKSDDFNG